MRTPSTFIHMASIVCAVRAKALLYIMRLAPFYVYTIIAAPLLVVAACGTDEGLKARVITLTVYHCAMCTRI